MDSIEKLTEIFRGFPGIGPRQAKRFVYYLLRKDQQYLNNFSSFVNDIKRSINQCKSCFRFFAKRRIDGADSPLCNICSSITRDKTQLMVVEKDADLENIEKSGAYNGLYFVLGGNIQILEKNPEDKVRLDELVERIKASGGVGDAHQGNTENVLTEIILSMSANSEGENTAMVIKEKIMPFCYGDLVGSEISANKSNSARNIKISVLGRGLSTGAELEYSDKETISQAIKHRD